MAISSLTTSAPQRLAMPLSERLLEKSNAAQNPNQGDFVSLLGKGVSEVNSLQQKSTQSVNEMLTGGDVQPTEVFASVQKADMAFRMLLQVRNKLMQAYEEVNSIRI
jgi:flagellar hook-basal body complex protein FliE